MCERIPVKVSTVTKQHAWKTPISASVARISNRRDQAGSTAQKPKGSVNCIKSLVILSQIAAVQAQDQEREWVNPILLYILAFIGLMGIYENLYQLGRLIREWFLKAKSPSQKRERKYNSNMALANGQTVRAPAAIPRAGKTQFLVA